MAERKQTRQGSSRRRSSSSSSSTSRQKKLNAVEAVRRAREQVEGLLGRPVETVSSFAPDGSNAWVVTVEIVELERIPESTSLLGSYEVKLDGSGDLVEARRIRRYSRNQVDTKEEE
jgi:Gas vesicle synthesis protein GvpO